MPAFFVFLYACTFLLDNLGANTTTFIVRGSDMFIL